MVHDRPPEEFGVGFLTWLRASTEQAWAGMADWSLADFARAGLVGPRWRPGTRWTGGLDRATLDQIETSYGVRFGWQHRLFLSTLHSTTPWQRGAGYGEHGGRLSLYQLPGFLDWVSDEAVIRSRMAATLDSREAVTEALADSNLDLDRVSCPELLPIYGHRYVVAHSTGPVVSIVGDDVIVYGRDLRDYLLHELSDILAYE